MTSTTYNGWANYPTWNVALWMDNDEGSYGYARELTRMAIAENTDYADNDDRIEVVDRDAAIADLADALEGWHGECMPKLEGFAADIFGWAIGHVNWWEIAEHLIGEEA